MLKKALLLSFIFIGCQMPNSIDPVDSGAMLEEEESTPTYKEQLESFSLLFGTDIIIPEELTPIEYFGLSVQIETYINLYDIELVDAEQAITDYGTDQEIIDTLFDLIEGYVTVEELMVEETGMFVDEEENIVLGLPFENDIPEDSPIEVYGTPTIVDDGIRVGMDFDSPDDYLIIPADETNNLTDEGTIDFWMKPDSIPTWGGIIHKGSENDWSDESYSLQYAYGNAITLALHPESDPNSFILVRGTTNMTTKIGQWVHVVVTWNSTEAHIYLDGVDDTLKTTYKYNSTAVDFSAYSPFTGSTGDVVVGKQVPNGNYQFDGVISDVVIYDVYTTEID